MEFSPPLKEEWDGDSEASEVPTIEVTADDGHVLVSIFAYFSLHPEDVNEDEYVPAGTPVEWHLYEWDPDPVAPSWVEATSGSFASTEGVIDDMGQAAADIDTGRVAGKRFLVSIVLPTYGSLTCYSGEIHVVAGVTRQITFQTSLDTEPVAPDHTFEVKATLYDQFGNLVIRSETETYFYETGLFEIAEEYVPSPDAQGQVTVRLRFKELIENEAPAVLTAEADSHVESTTLNVSPVVAQIFAEVPEGTGIPELSIDTPETVTLRARFRHANGENVRDGLPIRWEATNGQILSAQTSLTDGEATAVLSASGGRPGPAVITVTQVNGAYGANGQVLLRQANSAEVDCPFLPFDEEHTCPLLIRGPAGGGARITGGGTAPITLYAFTFESQENTLAGVFTPDANGALLVGVGPGTDWQFDLPGGGHALDCAGTRCGFVKGHARHGFRTGLMLDAYIIPNAGTAYGTVISKGADARLYLEGSRVRFHAVTSAGNVLLSSEELETTILPDSLGGYTIHAEFHLGMMRLIVNGQEVSVPVAGFLAGSAGPIGIGADFTATGDGQHQAVNVLPGKLDNVSIARIVRVRTGVNQLTLDANGFGSFPLTLDGGPDTPGAGDEINTDVVAVTVLIEITDASGTVVAGRSAQVLLTGRQHGENVELSTGEQGAGLSLGWEMIRHALKEQVLSPVRSVQYLCSIPFRDEVDWKQAGLSLWDVLTTVPIPGVQLARMKQIQKLVQAGGRMGKTVLFVTKLAGRAESVQNLLGYAGVLYTVYELAGATLEIVEMVLESKKDLDVLNTLHDYLEGNSRPLLEMVLDANDSGLNEEAGYPAGAAAPLAFGAAAPLAIARKHKRRKEAAHGGAARKDNLTTPSARADHKGIVSLGTNSHHTLNRILGNTHLNSTSLSPHLRFNPRCLLKILRSISQHVAPHGPIPKANYVATVKRLTLDGPQAMGVLSEIVFFIEQRSEFGLHDLNRKVGRTDVDHVGTADSRHQLKHSNEGNPPGYKSIRDWSKKMKLSTGDWSKLHFHTEFNPNLDDNATPPPPLLPKRIRTYLKARNINVHRFQLTNSICNP